MLKPKQLELLRRWAGGEDAWGFIPEVSAESRVHVMLYDKSQAIAKLADEVDRLNECVSYLCEEFATARRERDRLRMWVRRHKAVPKRGKTPSRIPPELGSFAEKLSEIDEPCQWAACVYFLICDSRLVYIGQSVSLPTRVEQHRLDGKSFDRVLYLPLSVEVIDDVEAVLIRSLRPPLNSKIVPDDQARLERVRRLGLLPIDGLRPCEMTEN